MHWIWWKPGPIPPPVVGFRHACSVPEEDDAVLDGLLDHARWDRAAIPRNFLYVFEPVLPQRVIDKVLITGFNASSVQTVSRGPEADAMGAKARGDDPSKKPGSDGTAAVHFQPSISPFIANNLRLEADHEFFGAPHLERATRPAVRSICADQELVVSCTVSPSQEPSNVPHPPLARLRSERCSTTIQPPPPCLAGRRTGRIASCTQRTFEASPPFPQEPRFRLVRESAHRPLPRAPCDGR